MKPQGAIATPPAAAPIWAAVAFGALAAFAPQIFNDGDTWTHVAAGVRMLDTAAVLHADPFSATFYGRPWQTHEWLSEIAFASAWRAAGWTGVALLCAAAAGATAGLMTRNVGRWIGGPALAAVAALALASLSSSFLARPHLLALPFLEMWTAELVIARSEGRLPAWRRLVPLMAVWANLHGSFFFGLGLLGAFGFEAVVRDWRRPSVLVSWAALGGAAVLATLLSPHGVDNLTFPLRLTAMSTLAGIGEWSPMVPAQSLSFELPLLAGVFILIWKQARLPLLFLLLLLLLVHLAFAQGRHVLLFGIVAPLLIAEPLGRVLEPAPPGRGERVAAALGVGLAVLLLTVRLALPVRLADSPAAPAAALAHVPAAVRARPVFNAYGFGGYLIYSGVRPYIDSRAEVYGDPFRAQYLRMAGGDRRLLGRELADRRIGWTLLEPGSPMVALMDAAPGWRRLYADRFAIVHVRAEGAPAASPRLGAPDASRP